MQEIIYSLEMVGVVAFALSGMIAARARNMDPVGIFTIAFITALGGGTLRDLLMDNHPLYWIRHEELPIVILVLTLAYSSLRPLSRLRESNILVPDAIGLGVFTLLGAQLALELGHSLFIASLLGVMTGTVGGALRDTLCHEIPFIFRKDQVYATVAFVGCWFSFLVNYLFDHEGAALVTGVVAIVALRLLAARFDIRLQRDQETSK